MFLPLICEAVLSVVHVCRGLLMGLFLFAALRAEANQKTPGSYDPAPVRSDVHARLSRSACR
jgi:hypothetical protein